MALLKPGKQRAALLGMLAFFGEAVSHLQAKLPLNNRVLKDLGCLNPLKRERKSTTISIQNHSRKLLPEFDTAAVLDEWKLYQNDGDISDINTDQRVDRYWNAAPVTCYVTVIPYCQPAVSLANVHTSYQNHASFRCRPCFVLHTNKVNCGFDSIYWRCVFADIC